MYELGDIELFFFPHESVTVKLPQSSTLTVNGVTVAENWNVTMADIGVELVDFKLEFGRFDGEVLLADEVSPDTCRFWDAKTHEPLDIDRFRRDLGDVEEGYREILHRLMLSVMFIFLGMDTAEEAKRHRNHLLQYLYGLTAL